RLTRCKNSLRIVGSLICGLIAVRAHALGHPQYVTNTPDATSFCLARNQSAIPLFVDATDWPGVIHAVGDLSEDLKRVTDTQPSVLKDRAQLHHGDAVLIGTIGKSPLIDELIRQHKLDVSGVEGKWESAVTTIVDRPMAGMR